MTTKDGYPNESPAIARRRRLPIVADYAYVRDDSVSVVDEILRRAAYGPVWADPNPTDFGEAPTGDERGNGFCKGCGCWNDDNALGCKTCGERHRYRRRRAAAAQTAAPTVVSEPEPFTHRCTTCGTAVTAAQSLLPCCPSCGAA